MGRAVPEPVHRDLAAFTLPFGNSSYRALKKLKSHLSGNLRPGRGNRAAPARHVSEAILDFHPIQAADEYRLSAWLVSA